MFSVALLHVILAAQCKTILLRNEKDLKNIKFCLTCNYSLENDITLKDPWMPLGTPSNPFMGVFDGNYYTITFAGFRVPESGFAGLFQETKNAEVCHINLDCNIPLTELAGARNITMGLVAGVVTDSVINGCFAKITSDMGIASGTLIVGAIAGSVTNSTVCRSRGTIISIITNAPVLYLGGLAGFCSDTSIDTCYANITVTVENAVKVYLGTALGASKGTAIRVMTVLGEIISRAPTKMEVIGGVIGLDSKDDKETSLQNFKSGVTITSLGSANATVGAALGIANGYLQMRAGDTYLFIKGRGVAATVGGIIGSGQMKSLKASTIYVNLTMDIAMAKAGYSQAYVGGLVGRISAPNNRITQSFAIIQITLEADCICAGGLIGASDGFNMSLQNSGALGWINAKTNESWLAEIGGIVGAAVFVEVLQCYFIGRLNATGGDELLMGGLVGSSYESALSSSFALANISGMSPRIVAGAVGLMAQSTIKSCYSAANISVEAFESLTLGGMVGMLNNNAVVSDSLVLGTLSVAGSRINTSIGGFVGMMRGKIPNIALVRCYAWGLVDVRLASGTNTMIGGFVGSIHNIGAIILCVAHITLYTPTSGTTAGLMVGVVRSEEATPSKRGGINLDTSIMYVIPTGGLRDVKLIGRNERIFIGGVICAPYANTQGCPPFSNLYYYAVRAGFDFNNVFQYRPDIANNTIVLRTVPVPLSDSTIDQPRLELPDASQKLRWPSESWIVDSRRVVGFPHLKTIDYVRYCRKHNYCFGRGISPIDTICMGRWKSPPKNSTGIADNLYKCNTRR